MHVSASGNYSSPALIGDLAFIYNTGLKPPKFITDITGYVLCLLTRLGAIQYDTRD